MDERPEDYNVKIFFIEPLSSISVVIDALINIEYEVYMVQEKDKEKLAKVFNVKDRNVIFFCITNQLDLPKWLKYVRFIQNYRQLNVQIGVFAYDHIRLESKLLFLEQNIPVIQFSDLRENTLTVLKRILLIFEARGKRKHIRTKTFGISEAFFCIPNLREPIRGRISYISSQAFFCELDPMYKLYFRSGSFFQEVVLILKGMKVKVSAKLVGFTEGSTPVYLFKLYTSKVVNNQVLLSSQLAKEIKNKIYNFIKSCLTDGIKEKLSKIKI
jgi:hypothetical protein